SFPQAVPAQYNPRFTKYTPGLANYERLVTQWESNVAVLTTEKGGTGVTRALRLGDLGVPVVLTPTTVAALPAAAAGLASAIAMVTDALAPAWGVNVAAGGAVKTMVMCNG